jgi:diketogulonate reductase-like aldo/keto reductase
MASGTTYMLNTGTRIPALGFGTWQDEDAQKDAVLAALKTGYRHIDTARIYGTEKAVGAAIKASGVPHDKIFLTTKLWNTDHHPDNVEKALDASIKDLQVDYVDLFLMVRLTKRVNSKPRLTLYSIGPSLGNMGMGCFQKMATSLVQRTSITLILGKPWRNCFTLGKRKRSEYVTLAKRKQSESSKKAKW